MPLFRRANDDARQATYIKFSIHEILPNGYYRGLPELPTTPMTWHVSVSDTLRRAVEKSFPAEDREHVERTLEEVESAYTRELIAVLANGVRQSFDQLIELERADWRNVQDAFEEQRQVLGTEAMARKFRELGLEPPEGSASPKNVVENVKRFVAENLIFPVERIDLRMRLQDDLGLDGLQGPKFIRAFAKQFDVDLSDFRPEVHFRPANDQKLFSNFVKWLFGRESSPTISIRVEDLMAAALTHRLVSPPGRK